MEELIFGNEIGLKLFLIGGTVIIILLSVWILWIGLRNWVEILKKEKQFMKGEYKEDDE